MASKYGSAYTDKFQTVPSVAVAGNKWGGKLRVCYDTYALSADLAAGDKIYMGKLPKGSRVIAVNLAWDALGAGTLDVGYEYNATGESSLTDDLDAFIDGVAVTNAGSSSMSAENANRAGFGYEVEGDADVVVSIATDTSATSGTIKLAVLYVVAG